MYHVKCMNASMHPRLSVVVSRLLQAHWPQCSELALLARTLGAVLATTTMFELCGFVMCHAGSSEGAGVEGSMLHARMRIETL